MKTGLSLPVRPCTHWALSWDSFFVRFIQRATRDAKKAKTRKIIRVVITGVGKAMFAPNQKRAIKPGVLHPMHGSEEGGGE